MSSAPSGFSQTMTIRIGVLSPHPYPRVFGPPGCQVPLGVYDPGTPSPQTKKVALVGTEVTNSLSYPAFSDILSGQDRRPWPPIRALTVDRRIDAMRPCPVRWRLRWTRRGHAPAPPSAACALLPRKTRLR